MEDIVRDVRDIASLPNVFERVTQVISNPQSVANDIAQVVVEDPGLTSRLLKLVNSPFFGLPHKIETVSRAVMVVGTEQLRDLVLSTSVVHMFNKIPEGLVSMESFWYHSLACGVIARTIGSLTNDPNSERLFIAGLLHDIGRLVLFMKMPDVARQVLTHAKDSTEPLYAIEKDVFSFNHAELGGALLKSWNLPSALQEAVGYHHAPDDAPNFKKEAAILHVADIITNAAHYGSSGERLTPPLSPAAWQSLGVTSAAIKEKMPRIDAEYKEAIKVILGN